MTKSLSIPEKNGQLYRSFPFSQVEDRIRENRRRLDLSTLSMGRGDGNAFRSSCREELTGLAASPRRQTLVPARAIILSGHQPLLYHPGIWIKNFLLHRIAKKTGALAVNLEVDSDQAGEVRVPFPGRTDQCRIFREPLGPAREGAPLESQAAPDPSQWGDFLARARSRLETLSRPRLLEGLKTLGEIGFQALREPGSLSRFLTRLRLEYEKPAGLSYCSLPLSRVCGTAYFLGFFMEIARHAERFAGIYNAALKDYRTRHKLRSGLNPFPDLQNRDGFRELPFWWLDEEGTRKTIFAAPGDSKKGLLFLAGGRKLWIHPAHAPEGPPGGATRIRPKALALTVFFRVFFCDLFIHGVGGAKYDEAADFIIREYFGITPPHYLAASLTLYPELGIQGPPAGEMEGLRASLRAMKFKPEKFIHLVSEPSAEREFRKLRDAKLKILRDPGEKGKAFFQEIHSINEAMASFLGPARAQMQRGLEGLERKAEEEKVRCFREYPFCLFDPLELARIAETY